MKNHRHDCLLKIFFPCLYVKFFRDAFLRNILKYVCIFLLSFLGFIIHKTFIIFEVIKEKRNKKGFTYCFFYGLFSLFLERICKTFVDLYLLSIFQKLNHNRKSQGYQKFSSTALVNPLNSNKIKEKRTENFQNNRQKNQYKQKQELEFTLRFKKRYTSLKIVKKYHFSIILAKIWHI